MEDADDHEILLFHAVSDDIASDGPEKVTLIRHVRACMSHSGKRRKHLNRSVKLEWDDGYWWFGQVGNKHNWWKLRYW